MTGVFIRRGNLDSDMDRGGMMGRPIREKTSSQAGGGGGGPFPPAPRENQPCSCLDLGPPSSRTMRKWTCYLSHPAYGTLFWPPSRHMGEESPIHALGVVDWVSWSLGAGFTQSSSLFSWWLILVVGWSAGAVAVTLSHSFPASLGFFTTWYLSSESVVSQVEAPPFVT